MIRLFSVLTVMFSMVTVGVLGSGCIISGDVDDQTFQLPQKQFHFDTGQVTPAAVFSMSTACVQSPADSCAAISPDLFCRSDGDCEVTDSSHLPDVPCTEDAQCAVLGDEFTCEQSAGSCMATVGFELSNDVNISNEVPELEEVGSYNWTSVRFKYIRMHVQENTFSVPTPVVHLYAAPGSVATIWATPDTLDPGVEEIGTVPSIGASLSGHTVDVELTPAGESALTGFCRDPNQTFKMFVYSEMTFHAGDPIPQGALTLIVDAAAVVSLK